MKVGKRPAAARADARAEQAGKPRFAAPVPLLGEVAALTITKLFCIFYCRYIARSSGTVALLSPLQLIKRCTLNDFISASA